MEQRTAFGTLTKVPLIVMEPRRPIAPGRRFQARAGAVLSDRERVDQVNQCGLINTGDR